ncbi:MAG TPA: efflux RND transporter periplasmic adaptor subunit [Desulfobacteraceae bacterium]|nr:efflux RND transporter periplasmic adaptor subunit [Desulfobacteraceae bacterium]
MSRKKLILISVVIIIAVLAGWRTYKKASTSGVNSTGRQSVPVAVETAPVQTRSIRNTGAFTGTLVARSRFIVAPKIAGRLEKLLLNIGDPVEEGQVVALLDDAEYQQQADQAQAELDVAKATLEESRITLEIAEREFERTVALRQKKIASESELDSAKAQYNNQEAKVKVAIAQVAQKNAALKAAQIRLSYARISVSWEDRNGFRVAGERFVDEGAMLAPNTPILSILDIGSITAVIHVIERDYSLIKKGKTATLTTDAFPGKHFTGEIVRIAPFLKETSRQARVEIEIPNPDGLLKPGMFIRAEIEFAKHENATVVPLSALTRRGGLQGVFIVEPQKKKAHFVPVTIGITDRDMAEVLDPSLSGEVVTLGHHLLEDGSAIVVAGKIKDEAGASSEIPEKNSGKPDLPAKQE